jgi:hypothetical protein
MVAKTRLHHGSVKIALTFLKRENHEIVCLAQRVFQRRDRWATSALAPIANSGTPLGTFKRKAVEKSRQQINDPRNISCRNLGKIASVRTSRKCSRKIQLLSSRRKAEKQTFRLGSTLPLRPRSGISKRISLARSLSPTNGRARMLRTPPVAANRREDLMSGPIQIGQSH